MANYTFTSKTFVAGDEEHVKRGFIEAGDASAEFGIDAAASTIYVSTSLSESDAEDAVDDGIAHTADEFPTACKLAAYTIVDSDNGKAIVGAGGSADLEITLIILRPQEAGWYVIIVNADTTYDIDIMGLTGSLAISPRGIKTMVWTGAKWADGTSQYTPS